MVDKCFIFILFGMRGENLVRHFELKIAFSTRVKSLVTKQKDDEYQNR